MSVRYHEVVIEGARGRAYGFVEGFLVARGLVGRIYDMEGEGFDCRPLRERVKELFHPSQETYHLLVRREELPVLEEAVAEGKARDLELILHDQREVSGARFAFSFHIYSRPHAARVRGWFEPAPRGVSLSSETKFVERVDPGAKGMEAYAPEHDYELSGAGVAEGTIDSILALYRKCSEEELVSAEPLELVV